MGVLRGVRSGRPSALLRRLATALVITAVAIAGPGPGPRVALAAGPTITSVTPSSAKPGDTVTINGSGFGASNPAGVGSCIHFTDPNQNAGTTSWGLFGNASNSAFVINSWSDTAITITVPVPSGQNNRWRVRPGSTATVAFHSGGGCPNDSNTTGSDVSSTSLTIQNTTNIADYFGDDTKMNSPGMGISNDSSPDCGSGGNDYLSASALANGLKVTNATWTTGTATATFTSTATTLAVGSTVTVAGVVPSGYNGTFAITGAGSGTVSYAVASNPGTFSGPGTITYTIPVTGASWSSSVATLTFATKSLYPNAGDQNANDTPSLGYVSVTGMTPSGYNGTYRVTGANNTSLSYALASNPGTFSSGGTATDGIWSGRTIAFGGFTFNWAPSSGCVSNVLNNDHWTPTLLFNPRIGADKLGVLGTGVGNSTSIQVTINYTDTTTDTKTLQFADWCGSAGTDQTLLDQMKYRNTGGNANSSPACNLYLDTITGLNTAKVVASVSLPSSGTNAGNMRIFAVALNGLAVSGTFLSSDYNPSVHGQGVTFTATVASGAVGTPTGTVQFKDGSTTLCAAAPLNSTPQATCGPFTNFTTDSHSITAVYSGDTNSATSTSNTVSQVVNKAATTTGVTSSTNPSVHGQGVTLTGTLLATSPGAGIPTGTIQFKVDGGDVGTPVAVDGTGHASTPALTNLTTANHTITAVYSGDGDFSGSTSSSPILAVNKAVTSISITGVNLATNTVVGQSYTVSWSVSVTPPGAGTPTGTVTISGASGCTVPVGDGQCTFASTVAGLKALVADYNGDPDFSASTSGSASHQVDPAATTIAITNGTDLATATVVGQPYTVKWSVTVTIPGAGTPGGTVTVSGGSDCTAPVGDGQCDVTSTAAGAKSLTAVYNGDANFSASPASTGVSHQVDPAATTTSVSSDVHPSSFGQGVTFTATVAPVSPGAGTPTGTVDFKEGSTVLCSAAALSGGQATCGPISSLSVGTHHITAFYSSSSDFTASDNTGADWSQEVDSVVTDTAVGSNHPASVFGQGVTFTATVTSGAGTPTGTVQFSIDGSPVGSALTLSGGHASYGPVSDLSVGNHDITAVYTGDGAFADSTSTSPTFTQEVDKAATTTAVTSDIPVSVFGQGVTFTATVSATAPGAGTPSGTVDFKEGSTVLCSTAALSGGQATCGPISSLSVGTHHITAFYSGGSDFTASDNTGADWSQEVDKADTTTAVTSDIHPSVFGQGVTFTTTVSAAAPGAGTPGGSVQFKVDGTPAGSPVALSGGHASSTLIADLSVGDHAITAVYSGGPSFTGSTSDAFTQTVGKAATTTSVSSDVHPSSFGQGVTFTATVAPVSPGAGTPTGTVDFKEGSTVLCSAAALSGGQATCGPISSLSVGTHHITAFYSSSSDFTASDNTAADWSQEVDQTGSSTALSSDHHPSVFGQPVTITATVTGSGGTPSGTVQFSIDASPVGSAVTLDGGGHANSDPISDLSVGTHNITAVYGGDSSFIGSTSDALSQEVDNADTTTVVTSDIHPSVFGQGVTFTATVSAAAPGAGTPAGSVQFSIDGHPVGTPVTLNSGQASYGPVSDLAVDSHEIQAVYGGGTSFNGSTSHSLTQAVDRADTTTSAAANTSPSVYGQGVTFTATITVDDPGHGTPTGSVHFTVDGHPVGSAVALDGSGHATSDPVSDLSVGHHDVGAVYGGDTDFNGSTSHATDQEVDRAATATVAAPNTSPSVYGQGVTFTATVTATAPGAGTGTGTVRFWIDGSPVGSAVALDGSGHAISAPVTDLSVGSHAVTAVYSGDSSFATSTSVAATQVVNQALTSTGLSSNHDPSVFGQAVTFMAVVTATAPGAGTPSGTVQFSVDGSPVGSPVTLNGSGRASSGPISSLSVASHVITVSYGGDTNFITSTSGLLIQAVNKASTATALSSNHRPSVFGQAVTFTATITARSPGSGTPIGSVQFTRDGVNLDSPVLMVAGHASYTVSSLTVGAHQIKATYLGSGSYLASRLTLSQAVTKAATTVVVTSNHNPSAFGYSVKLSATVAAVLPGAGVPTGKVQFTIDGHKLGGPVSLSGGRATYTISYALTIGRHTIRATYLGSASYLASTSHAYTQTVNRT